MIMDHLPCHGGAQIDVRRVRGQQQRFQPRMQAPVHHGLLILRVEIALGPDAPDNGGSTEAVGEKVMDRLRKVDQVAYVRFASVYRQFKDLDTFMAELNKLLAEK